MANYWQDYLNKSVYAALISQFSGERKPKLTAEKMIELKSLLKKKDYWTKREILELIKEKYGVEYSFKRKGIILKSF